jgi:hypothetical protein
MTPTNISHERHDAAAGRIAARIENMNASVDPVPVSRAKTVSPGTLLLVAILGCVAVATLGNWLHTETTAFNAIFVKFFMVLIPVVLLAIGYFFVRFVGFWRESRAAEKEAMEQAEAELLELEARFAAGRIKGDRRLVIRPLNPAKRAAKRRRADKLRTA